MTKKMNPILKFYEHKDRHGMPIGDFILHNGETIKEIPEIQEALLQAITEAREEGKEEGLGHRINFGDDGYARAIKKEAILSDRKLLKEKIEGLRELVNIGDRWNACLDSVLNLIENKQ